MRLEREYKRFLPEVKEIIDKIKESFEDYRERELRVSICSHSCLRYQYFYYTGAKTINTLHNNELGAFKFGNLIHQEIELRALSALHYFVTEDYTHITVDNNNIIGHCDIVLYKDDLYTRRRRAVTIIDIKTTAALQWVDKYGINKGYLRQLAAYVHATGAKRGVLMFIEKANPHGIATVTLTATELKPYYEEFIENVRRIIRHLEREEVPPRNESGLCKYCGYKHLCSGK